MRTTLQYLSLSAALLAAPFAVANDITFQFDDVNEFRDFTFEGQDEEETKEIFLTYLNRWMEREDMSERLGNQSLTVTFHNIDLAGDYEWWRDPSYDDVRFLRDIYPPRMSVSYTLRGENGEVIAEGEQDLINMTYLSQPTLSGGDPFYYDFNLLGDWLKRQILPKVEMAQRQP